MRIQTDNGFGDLIFLGVAVVLIALSLRVLYLVLRRKRIAKTLAVGLAVAGAYGATLIVSGVLTPQSLAPPGTAKCSDEWCVTVESAKVFPPIAGYVPQGRLVVISIRVFSESRGRTQHGSNPVIYVLTEDGRQYRPSAMAQAAVDRSLGAQPPMTKDVVAGESFVTQIAFELPAAADRLRVNVAEQPWITKLILFNDNAIFSGGTLFEVPVSDR